MVRAELLSIGDELVIGQVVNTNASHIAQALGRIGIDVHRITTVGDSEQQLRRSMRRAWQESDIVIATGGLGPTHDDISKHVVAKFFKKPLHLDAKTLKFVQARFKRFGYQTMPESNIGQAMVPEGFVVLRNDQGTAPGLAYREKQKTFIILPGVPHEMEWLMAKWVLPMLRKAYKKRISGVILHHVIQTAGIGESALAEKIGDVKEFLPAGMTLAYLPRIGGVRLRLTMRDSTEAAAKRKLAKAEAYIRSRAGRYIFGTGESPIEYAVVNLLQAAEATVATAESCTGGLIATRITNVPGSSEVFPGGVVAYANRIKTLKLGVDQKIIDQFGAVSEEVAIAMAEGALKAFGTVYALSVTGIAGPSGGTKEKPVGTVWVALAQQCRSTATKVLHNVGDRTMIRERSTEMALEFLRQRLNEG